jgi:hypothetical protein
VSFPGLHGRRFGAERPKRPHWRRYRPRAPADRRLAAAAARRRRARAGHGRGARLCAQRTIADRNCVAAIVIMAAFRCANRRPIWVDSQKSTELGRFSLGPERVIPFVPVELPESPMQTVARCRLRRYRRRRRFCKSRHHSRKFRARHERPDQRGVSSRAQAPQRCLGPRPRHRRGDRAGRDQSRSGPVSPRRQFQAAPVARVRDADGAKVAVQLQPVGAVAQRQRGAEVGRADPGRGPGDQAAPDGGGPRPGGGPHRHVRRVGGLRQRRRRHDIRRDPTASRRGAHRQLQVHGQQLRGLPGAAGPVPDPLGRHGSG